MVTLTISSLALLFLLLCVLPKSSKVFFFFNQGSCLLRCFSKLKDLDKHIPDPKGQRFMAFLFTQSSLRKAQRLEDLASSSRSCLATKQQPLILPLDRGFLPWIAKNNNKKGAPALGGMISGRICKGLNKLSKLAVNAACGHSVMEGKVCVCLQRD